MEWLFDNNAPIYSQLIDRIKLGIVSGELPPGLGCPQCGIWPRKRGSTPTRCSGRCRNWKERHWFSASGPQADM